MGKSIKKEDEKKVTINENCKLKSGYWTKKKGKGK